MEWSSFICTFWVKPCNLINPWISFNYWNKKQETRHTADHISFATGNWHLWELLVSGAVRHRSRAGRGRDSDTGKSLRPRKEGREGELHLRLFFFLGWLIVTLIWDMFSKFGLMDWISFFVESQTPNTKLNTLNPRLEKNPVLSLIKAYFLHEHPSNV